MSKTVDLHIPLGFRLEDKIEYMKIWEAEQRLLSRKIRRYTKAVRSGEDAQLYSRWLICPHCASAYIANTHSPVFHRYGVCSTREMRLTKEQISQWATMQMSIFDETEAHELLIAPPIASIGKFRCEKCENESYKSASTRRVTLSAHRKKVTVKCEVSQIDEILSVGWVKRNEVKISFPIFEVLTFDFNRGAVYIKIENAQGDTLCQRDISAYPDQLKGGAVYKILTQNKLVLRNVRRLFQRVWGTQLPFSWKQLDLQALFQMTMFVGYPKSFYSCIPYVQNSCRIDRDFRARAKRMHLAENLNGVYQRSSLPQIKSIRRIMFGAPGLFFYLQEVEEIWNAIGDPNLLARLLQSERVYEILSAIHTRPGISQYLRDYSAVKGAVGLLTNMEGDWDYLLHQAVDYCCMSRGMRLRIRQRWKTGESQMTVRNAYSLPMCHPDERITDCVINGYHFAWLRNSNDYALAAEHLQNCLDMWHGYDAPVVGVRRKARFVAAIAVCKGCVEQALGFENGPMDADPELNTAFQKWMARFGLKWSSSEENPEDDLEWRYPADAPMPF